MLYLFDGSNVLHAGKFDDRRELVDRLATFVAYRGAQGIVVFDGAGEEVRYGSLEVRFASPADRVVEKLAAEWAASGDVCVVSSDRAVRETAGRDVRVLSSQAFLRELVVEERGGDVRGRAPGSRVEDALDAETRARLERWRRRRY